MIERYRHDDADGAFSKDFLSIDPGIDGGCVVFKDGISVECLPTALCVDTIADAMQRHGLSTIVVERQFVKMNAASALELAWRTGMMLGAVANEVGGTIHLVEVYPTTWQSFQRKKFKIKGKLNRLQGIVLAIEATKANLAPQLWSDQVECQKKAIIEGICSAYGIGDWFIYIQDGGDV